jgi:hypothetical protein
MEPTEKVHRVDPTEAADRADPTDPTDRAEPTDPKLSTDPADPIDSTDPVLAIDRNESSDHNERSPMGDILALHPARDHVTSQPGTGPGGARSSFPLARERADRYRLNAERAPRVGVARGLRLVDRRAAVGAVRRHRPGRARAGPFARGRLPLRTLLALDVIVQRALLQGGHVDDEPGPVGGVVPHGDPRAVGQRELDLGYPARVAELLGSPDLRQPPRFVAARGGLVKIGQFLTELDRLAVFEADFNAHVRHPSVGIGKLAVQDHALDGSPIAQEPFPLGLAQLLVMLVMLVMIKQNRTPGGRLLG